MEYNEYKKLQEEGSGLSFGTSWGDQMEEAILLYLSNVSKTSKIIDVGCGEGRGLLALKNIGFQNLFGIDISTPKVLMARERGLNVVEGDFHKLNEFVKDEFDYLFCSHAIEHSLDPICVLKNMYHISKNGLVICPIDEKPQPPLGKSPHTYNFSSFEEWLNVWNKALPENLNYKHNQKTRLGNEVWSYWNEG